MRLYIITILGATVMSAAVNMITPEQWKKYVGIVTGLVIALSIGRPIFYMMRTDALSEIALEPQDIASGGEALFYDELRAELEERIEHDAKARLGSEFGIDCAVTAEVDTDDTGRICGVKSITIHKAHIDNTVIGRLREIYGAEEVVAVGTEKDFSKAE